MIAQTIYQRIGLFIFLVASMLPNASAQQFRLLTWNIESNRPAQPPVSDPTVISRELTEMLQADFTKSQLIALSEVDPKSIKQLVAAAQMGLQQPIDYVTSASGGFQDTDTLLFMVDSSRFQIRDTVELHRYAGLKANFNVMEEDQEDFGALRARSPLAVKLVDQSSQQTFWVIVTHLARGEADLRTEQAKMLRQWASDHPMPIIAAGDFNFDYDFKTQQGNPGFQAMMEGDTWLWLKPDPLIDSNWSDDRRITDRRVDRYPDSILDFVFVANQAKQWHGESDVVVRPNDFPDNEKTSDHRPLVAVFKPNPDTAAPIK